MPKADAGVAALTQAIQGALGNNLVCLATYGSAAGDDWIEGRSNLNLAVVVHTVTLDVLERLAPILRQHQALRLALPLVVDPGYLAQARDTFPMELDDLRRQHRVLAGTDVFRDLTTEPAAIRRECEREARGKLLRLRAHFLAVTDDPHGLEQLMLESLKSYLFVLRHYVRLRQGDGPQAFAAVVAAAERLLGPLPTLRQLLEHRQVRPHDASRLRQDFAAYLGEVERIVTAIDQLDV